VGSWLLAGAKKQPVARAMRRKLAQKLDERNTNNLLLNNYFAFTATP